MALCPAVSDTFTSSAAVSQTIINALGSRPRTFNFCGDKLPSACAATSTPTTITTSDDMLMQANVHVVCLAHDSAKSQRTMHTHTTPLLYFAFFL